MRIRLLTGTTFISARGLLFLFFILSITVRTIYAQGVRGSVKAENGEPLAYTTIFVKQTGSGTTTNENGDYEISLPAAGRYEIVFQYLGYETAERVAVVSTDFVEINVTLKTQVTVLPTVTINAEDEDPAYTIMRKAIAKAKYHLHLLDNYSARVYIKGSGQLKDYPWLAKKRLEKEGIEKGRVFVMESISDIKYTRPGKFEEKVISIRSDGRDNNTSPTPYIFGSFYEPEVAETISPLSPKAFSYYKFEYLGTFKDRDYEVSRIKVIPRSKGDDVVDGVLNIVEDWWAIHSMDIHTSKLGIDVNIKAVYAPIEEKAWMPVSHRFKVDGKVFGFDFEFNYLATVSGYKIKVNPDVYIETKDMQVVDEKIEKEEAKKIEEKIKPTSKKALAKQDQTKQLQKRLSEGKEITRKELNTIVKEYEKAEVKQQPAPEIIANTTYKIDSGAYKKDSSYWASVRPVPLTKEEVKGYQKQDSLAEVTRKREEGDTLKASKHKGFQPWDLIIGDNYKISKHSNLKIFFPIPNFNTVDGWNFNYKVTFGTILQDTNRTQLKITPVFRYAFSRKEPSGYLDFSVRNKNYNLKVQGGRFIQQYNPDEPILPIVNSFMTLFLEKNLMKIYERDYIDLSFKRNLNPNFSIHTDWSWARRRELFNTSDFKIVNRDKIEDYTPNRPVNEELLDTSFPNHDAFIGSIGVTVRPWIKYTVYNDRRMEVPNSAPIITLDYRKGFNGALNSSIDFDQLELGIKHGFKIGVRGNADIALRGGIFLNSDKLYFMDYKHFQGNKTPFITNDPVGSFRLLEYYQFSTADKYFAGNVHYQFRKFLITNIPLVRMAGVRENVFVNYLASPTSKNYTEVGYSIDGILRFLRLEAAASFRDGKYLDYGFRIGIASYITANFSDD